MRVTTRARAPKRSKHGKKRNSRGRGNPSQRMHKKLPRSKLLA